MLSDSQFRKLASGQWGGPVAASLRGVLRLLEFPYGWFVRRLNSRFDRGVEEQQRVAAPVISVGNLTVGGTGKTPLVAWLAQWFESRQIAVTIISRGYGARRGRPNDEALELAARLPSVPHVQNPDRVAAAREALRSNSRQVLILDDAFQHRRLARDLDIVLLDALEPFGFEHMLPRGLLREPTEGLGRAQVVILSRSDAISSARRREIEMRVRGVAPEAAWVEMEHGPVGLLAASGARRELSAMAGEKVAVFCGIGNPAGFRHTLAGGGIVVEALLELPDHCPYGPSELFQLEKWLHAVPNVREVICTRKDLVKIPRDELAGKRLWALDVEVRIARGQEELESTLEKVARRL
jgi:tetraacyldisaccharide 4'-kinase